MKVYITKYSLTQGIIEADVEDVGDGIVADNNSNYVAYYHGEGKEWHRTKVSAIKKAEEMRNKKIKALKKQITKLENIKWET